MVPLLESRDATQTQLALDALDRAGVPALTSDWASGLLMAPVPEGVTVIVVPRQLVADAKSALEQSGLQTSSRPLPVPTSVIPLASSNVTAEPIAGLGASSHAAHVVSPVRPVIHPDEEEGPLEAPPFEGASAQSRFVIALAGCTVGAVVQASLLAQGGFERVHRLALSWDGERFGGNVVAAGFLHGGTAHFLGNLAIGLLLGFVLVGTHGLGATAAVWLAASMLGIAAEAFLSPGAHVLGASAGIYGLVGLWVHGEWARAARAVLPGRIRWRVVGFMMLLAPVAMSPVTSSGSRVAVIAHLVGFFVGLLAGVFFPRWWGPEDHVRHSRRGRWAFVTAAAICAAGLASAFLAVS